VTAVFFHGDVGLKGRSIDRFEDCPFARADTRLATTLGKPATQGADR
jgi:hypothetical protein